MKVFYMGRRVNGQFDSFKMWLRRAVRFVVRWSVITGAGYAVFMAGAILYSTETVTATVIQTSVSSPVLDRIADCESGTGAKGSATQTINGQVLLRGNTNKTVDVGKYQINMTYWGKKASELGYDITTEAGNTAMAEWIYANKGTGDWAASQKCWK